VPVQVSLHQPDYADNQLGHVAGTWQVRPRTHFEQFPAQRRPQVLLAVTTAEYHVGLLDGVAPTVQGTVLSSSAAVKRARSDGGALVLSFETSGRLVQQHSVTSRKT